MAELLCSSDLRGGLRNRAANTGLRAGPVGTWLHEIDRDRL
jgi:hypothetical protein